MCQGGTGGTEWGTARVLLPPSSSDGSGVCGRRRRLQKQEALEYELLNAFKCSLTVRSSQGANEQAPEVLCFDDGPVFFVSSFSHVGRDTCSVCYILTGLQSSSLCQKAWSAL